MFLIIIYSVSLLPINLNLPISASINATSGISLLVDNPSNSGINPALSNCGIETSVTYLFGLKELPYYNVYLDYDFGNFGFCLGNSYLDHSLYKENVSKFITNYRLGSISIGLSICNLYNEIENYQTKNSFLMDAGIVWEKDNIKSGLSFKNVTQSSFLNEKLPVYYLWESCLYLSSKSKIAIALEKEDNFDFSFKIANRYDLFKIMTILGSYQYNPDRIGVGLIFRLAKWNITFSVRTHQYLNLTQYISVSYIFHK